LERLNRVLTPESSGIERTLEQWQSLFQPVGLEIVKIWTIPSSKDRVIELKVAQ
jgi:hypothetical protein